MRDFCREAEVKRTRARQRHVERRDAFDRLLPKLLGFAKSKIRFAPVLEDEVSDAGIRTACGDNRRRRLRALERCCCLKPRARGLNNLYAS
jgi:hypothetical protein